MMSGCERYAEEDQTLCKNVLFGGINNLNVYILEEKLFTTDFEASSPGVRARINADAVMPPASWAMQYNMNRSGFNAPTNSNAKLMLGLNTAPVTL